MQDPRKHRYSCSCVKTKKYKRKCHIKPLDLEKRLILYTWLGQRLCAQRLCATFLIVEIFQGAGCKYGRYLRVRLNTFLLQVSKPWPESEHLHRPTEQNNLILKVKGCIFSSGWNHLTKGKTQHRPVSWRVETGVKRKALLSCLKWIL